MADEHSDYIVYVDESGDHGLVKVDPSYPMFVLAFCVFEKRTYIEKVVPAVQAFKFRHFGHDQVVLHEHGIRKQTGDFVALQQPAVRDAFMAELSTLMAEAAFKVIACVIDKPRLVKKYSQPINPYDLSVLFGLERLYRYLHSRDPSQPERLTHVVVETRGKLEDEDLKKHFDLVAGGRNDLKRPLPFRLIMSQKATNCTGLQLSDMVARPIGIKVLRPEKANRAYEIIETKFHRGPSGTEVGHGLKVFP